jgi:hypothetical protein
MKNPPTPPPPPRPRQCMGLKGMAWGISKRSQQTFSYAHVATKGLKHIWTATPTTTTHIKVTNAPIRVTKFQAWSVTTISIKIFEPKRFEGLKPSTSICYHEYAWEVVTLRLPPWKLSCFNLVCSQFSSWRKGVMQRWDVEGLITNILVSFCFLCTNYF